VGKLAEALGVEPAELLCQQATTIALTLAGAVVSLAVASGGALAFIKGNGNPPHIYPALIALYSLLGFFVIGVGRHGRKLSLKHYERNRRHTALAGAYRKCLEDLFPGYPFGDSLRTKAKASHMDHWNTETENRGAYVINERLYLLWSHLFGFLNWVAIFLIVVPLIVAVVLALHKHF
jgi:hypothetical protein